MLGNICFVHGKLCNIRYRMAKPSFVRILQIIAPLGCCIMGTAVYPEVFQYSQKDQPNLIPNICVP